MTLPEEQGWFDEFHVEGELPWQLDYVSFPYAVGDGIIDSLHNYRRLRIVDIWWSTDKHGAFDWGRHIFCEDVTQTDDDRLLRLRPEYFSD